MSGEISTKRFYLIGKVIVIRNDLVEGKMYGGLECDKDHVSIRGTVQFVKRVRDSLYSDGFVVEGGIVISEEMIDRVCW